MGDRLLAEYDRVGNRYLYYTQDPINSTRIVTDNAGTVVYSEAYAPYGGVQETWVDSFDPLAKFSGKERDAESQLDYFGARYYDREQYRFISVDPMLVLQSAQADPQRWNLYSYCFNNPVNAIDPSGKWGKTVHYDWTKRIGIMAGISSDLATSIAEANRHVDSFFSTTSSVTLNEQQRKDWHFISTERYIEALKICDTTLDPLEFGKYLHVVQDYFAHSAPTLKGETGHWGKKKYKGIDDPYSDYHDWDKTMGMAHLTLDLMRAFRERITQAVTAAATSIVAAIRGI